MENEEELDGSPEVDPRDVALAEALAEVKASREERAQMAAYIARGQAPAKEEAEGDDYYETDEQKRIKVLESVAVEARGEAMMLKIERAIERERWPEDVQAEAIKQLHTLGAARFAGAKVEETLPLLKRFARGEIAERAEAGNKREPAAGRGNVDSAGDVQGYIAWVKHSTGANLDLETAKRMIKQGASTYENYRTAKSGR